MQKIGFGRSGFPRSAARKSASCSGRNDDVWGSGRERHSGRYAPLENAGILRCAQNDDVKLTTARTKARARAGWENVYIPTLATIRPSRRWGTQAYFGWG